MKTLYANFAKSVLANQALSGDTRISISDISKFPEFAGGPGEEQYKLALIRGNDYEIVYVTGVWMANQVTVLRAQEGTTARTWPAGETEVIHAPMASDHTFFQSLQNRANQEGMQDISTITNLTSTLAGKQPTLVSGTNIKTINGTSVLGTGDIVINPVDPNSVKITGNQTIAGVKTFTSPMTITGGVKGKNASTDAFPSFHGEVAGGTFASMWNRRGALFYSNKSDSGSSYAPTCSMVYTHNTAYVGVYSFGVLNNAAGDPGAFVVHHCNAAGGAHALWKFNGATGDFEAQGDVKAFSDTRLKKDWNDVRKDFVERLAELRNGSYTRTDTGARQAGVPAQELKDILPEVVGETSDGMLTVAYGNAALVACVNLAQRCVALERRLNQLEGK